MSDRIKNSLPGAVGGAVGAVLVLWLKRNYRGINLFWCCVLEFGIIFLMNFLVTYKDKSQK